MSKLYGVKQTYRALLVSNANPATAEEALGEDKAMAVETVPASEFLELEELPDVHVMLVDWALSRDEFTASVSRCKQLDKAVILLVPQNSLATFAPLSGADDFVAVPLRPGELAARVRILLQRTKTLLGDKVLKAGDVEIDQARYEVYVGGRKALLTYKEYQMLLLLASNPGHVYSREALLSQVWGYDYFGGTRTVDVHVRRIRSKLEASTTTSIETVWNVGYRLVVQGQQTA
jgi:DNA-binding response OmpR family regulator